MALDAPGADHESIAAGLFGYYDSEICALVGSDRPHLPMLGRVGTPPTGIEPASSACTEAH